MDLLTDEASANVPQTCTVSDSQHWLREKKKKTLLVCELCKKENDPNSHLVYYLDKQSRNEIMAPVAHFKSSSIQREVNEGPMWNKIDNKAGYD